MANPEDDDLGFVPDADLGFVPEQDSPVQQPQPSPRAYPTTSRAEASGRGLVQGATALLGDEIDGVVQTMYSLKEKGDERLNRAIEKRDPRELFGNPKEDFDFALKEYRHHRDATRAENDAAAAEHPGYFGTTRVAGAVPSAIATGGMSTPALMGLGGVAGVAGSNAELTPDKVTPQSLQDADYALSTGVVTGGLARQFPNLARYGFPVIGAGLAAFGDELGMTDADRVSAGVGTALALPSLAGDVLKRQAAKTVPVSQKARGELADDFQTRDLADDAADAKAMQKLLTAKESEREALRRAAVAKARAGEDEDFRVQQEEAKRQGQLQKLSQDDERIRARQENQNQSRVVSDYESEQQAANQKYADWFKGRVKDIQLRAKVRQDRAKTLAEAQKAEQDAEQELTDLMASINGRYAQAHQAAATRVLQYGQLTGEDLPPSGQALKTKLGQRYKDNSDFEGLDPDYVKAQDLGIRVPALQARLDAAKAARAKVEATPFDEDAAVREAMAKSQVVDRAEALAMARSLGLDPGDVNAFNPVPNPKSPWSLNKPRPQDPAPLPDPNLLRLATNQSKRQQLQMPAQGPVRRTEQEILRGSGLDEDVRLSGNDYVAKADGRPPVDARVSAVVENARPGAVAQVQNAAMKGGLAGMGVGALGGQQVPGAQALGPGVLGPVGAYLGARGAIRSLSDIDVMTGKFKNPAQVAAVMESIERTLMKYPNLGEKYLGIFGRGVKPLQVMFYIQTDPELRRALDEDASSSAEGGVP